VVELMIYMGPIAQICQSRRLKQVEYLILKLLERIFDYEILIKIK
jgi:hypothetical protein